MGSPHSNSVLRMPVMSRVGAQDKNEKSRCLFDKQVTIVYTEPVARKRAQVIAENSIYFPFNACSNVRFRAPFAAEK